MKNNEDDDLKKELEEAKERIRNLERPSINDYKSEGTTLILSILLGLIGIMGIGHIYIGKKARGGLILIGGLFLTFALFMLTVGASTLYGGTPLSGNVAVANSFIPYYLIPYLALYIWQIIDSRKKCKYYNEYLEEHLKRPW